MLVPPGVHRNGGTLGFRFGPVYLGLLGLWYRLLVPIVAGQPACVEPTRSRLRRDIAARPGARAGTAAPRWYTARRGWRIAIRRPPAIAHPHGSRRDGRDDRVERLVPARLRRARLRRDDLRRDHVAHVPRPRAARAAGGDGPLGARRLRGRAGFPGAHADPVPLHPPHP